MDSQATIKDRSWVLCAAVGVSATTDWEVSQPPDVSGKSNGLSSVRQSEDEFVFEGDSGLLRNQKAPYDAYRPLYLRHDNHAGEQCKIGECIKNARPYEYPNDTPLRPHYEWLPCAGDEQSRRDYGRVICTDAIWHFGEIILPKNHTIWRRISKATCERRYRK